MLDDISSTELLINIKNIYKRKRAIAKMTPKIGTMTVNAPISIEQQKFEESDEIDDEILF